MRRVKYRYVALRVRGGEALDTRRVVEAVRNAVFQLYGEYGASRTQLVYVAFDAEKDYVVLRCSLKTLEMVRAAIAAVMHVDGADVAFHTVGVSGSLRALRQKLAAGKK